MPHASSFDALSAVPPDSPDSPAMIICVCKAINDRAIRRAVADGHDTFDAIQFELGVGTCCGKCVESACEVLCEARSATCGQPVAADHRPVRFAPRPERREVALA